MFDIKFYMKAFDLKYRLMKGEKLSRQYVFDKLETFRCKEPIVYNFETTNMCNMRCKMCPRTTAMTRKIEIIDDLTFEKVVNQLRPFSDEDWQMWEDFVEKNYRISPVSMSENHFFLYIIPKVLVLHGYGDPLLDENMPKRIKILAKKNIPSYFSCNPSNINIEKTTEMFDSGLDYIKFSIESTNDLLHKEIRGNASNFKESYGKIIKLLDLKKRNRYKATVVITMLNLGWQGQKSDFQALKKAFEGLDAYVYLKSQDQKWYDRKIQPTESLHWLEFCQFPWSSMTVKSNGEAAMCVEDYNNEIILGDTKKESLHDIWNGQKYHKLRYDHFNLTRHIKCTGQCDMTLVGNLVN
jgi:MoaA/NifB/PqqE/SkfB family radical SAM enzyme